jgi:hypothetical protein
MSYAVGKTYQKELKGLIESVIQLSKPVRMVYGLGEAGNNTLEAYVQYSNKSRLVKSYNVELPVKKDHLVNWNNIGFMKPMWIAANLIDTECSDIVLWLDADARVRGDLNVLEKDMRDADFGLVRHYGEWIAGTIGLRREDRILEWMQLWSDACLKQMRPKQPDWTVNDQTVMRKLIMQKKSPGIIDLGPKWASLPPALVGDKSRPINVSPTDDRALIWHWQASRGTVHNWNWPPEEKDRAK